MRGPGGTRLHARATTILLFLVLLFPAGSSATIPQNDADSGQDAPNVRADDVAILPGIVYTATLVPGADPVDFFAFSASAGQEIELAVAGAPVCAASILDPAGRVISAGCNALAAPHVYAATTREVGTHYFRFSTFATAYRFAFQLDGSAPDPLGVFEGVPAPGADPTCGTGVPVTQTGGLREGVVFAALKTGFRGVVAWSTQLPEIATLTYSIDGGASVTLSDAGPRTTHVFLVDGLDVGRTFCFTSSAGVSDAFVLRNAMTSLRDGKYTLNMLLTAPLNVQARDIMDEGIAIYKEKLYDATDGHIQPGQTIMLYVDPEHANTGTYTCSNGVLPNPPCDRRVDVTFSYDSCAGGAACAPQNGVSSPNAFIMMNSAFDANPATGGLLFGANEVGTVLVHELGHYLFGAQDLYVAGDCFDAALSLSIMGGARSVTEYDDEVHRCPNEAQLGAGYITTWTKMRGRFPGIPDRTGPIDEGPHGGGALFAYTTLSPTPNIEEARDSLIDTVLETEVEQDDAGSGGDAPANPAMAVEIEPGVLHEGTLLPTDVDTYRFRALAGQAVELSLYVSTVCPALTDGAGERVAGQSCELTPDGSQRVRATAPGGELRFRIAQSTTTPSYRFGVGLDAPAPSWP